VGGAEHTRQPEPFGMTHVGRWPVCEPMRRDAISLTLIHIGKPGTPTWDQTWDLTRDLTRDLPFFCRILGTSLGTSLGTPAVRTAQSRPTPQPTLRSSGLRAAGWLAGGRAGSLQTVIVTGETTPPSKLGPEWRSTTAVGAVADTA
jgi:hypothetical protein